MCVLGVLVFGVSTLLHVENPTPDFNTYLVMIDGLCKQGCVDSVLNIFDRAIQRQLNPNVGVYDTIIASLGRERRIFKAEDMFKRMHLAGIDPDETMYTTLINAYGKSGRLVEACELFERMVERSVKTSFYTYTAIISGFVINNMFKNDMMINDGPEPNHVLCTSLISNFLKRREFEFAFELVDLMVQIEYDLLTHISLLSGVCRHIKSANRIQGIRRQMSKRAKKTPLDLFQGKVLGLGTSYLRNQGDSSAQGMNQYALKLLQWSEEKMFLQNFYLYNAQVYDFCQVDKMEKANERFQLIWSEGLSANQVMFTILTGSHMTRGEINNAIRRINIMNAEGYPLDAYCLQYSAERPLYVRKVISCIVHCFFDA